MRKFLFLPVALFLVWNVGCKPRIDANVADKFVGDKKVQASSTTQLKYGILEARKIEGSDTLEIVVKRPFKSGVLIFRNSDGKNVRRHSFKNRDGLIAIPARNFFDHEWLRVTLEWETGEYETYFFEKTLTKPSPKIVMNKKIEIASCGGYVTLTLWSNGAHQFTATGLRDCDIAQIVPFGSFEIRENARGSNHGEIIIPKTQDARITFESPSGRTSDTVDVPADTWRN